MNLEASEALINLVQNGPVYLAGDADENSIERRLEVIRARSQGDSLIQEGNCNMGWGWGN